MHYSDIDVSCLHTELDGSRSIVSDYKDCLVKHGPDRICSGHLKMRSEKSDDEEYIDSHPASETNQLVVEDCKSFCFSDETDSCEDKQTKEHR